MPPPSYLFSNNQNIPPPTQGSILLRTYVNRYCYPALGFCLYNVRFCVASILAWQKRKRQKYLINTANYIPVPF